MTQLTNYSNPRLSFQVWKKLLSLSFSHEELTSFWRDTFIADFEGKLKQVRQVFFGVCMPQICTYETKLRMCASVLGKAKGSNWSILQTDGRTAQDKSIVMQYNGEMCVRGSCRYLSGMILISGEQKLQNAFKLHNVNAQLYPFCVL